MRSFRIALQRGDVTLEVTASTLEEAKVGLEELQRESTHPSTFLKAPTNRSDDARGESSSRDIVHVVNAIKDSELLTALEASILNKSAELPRVLMCAYFAESVWLQDPYVTTTDVQTITTELGVKIKSSNANRSFSGAGRKYFTADKVRRRGVAVRYRINRAGRQYFQSLIGVNEQ